MAPAVIDPIVQVAIVSGLSTVAAAIITAVVVLRNGPSERRQVADGVVEKVTEQRLLLGAEQLQQRDTKIAELVADQVRTQAEIARLTRDDADHRAEIAALKVRNAELETELARLRGQA